MFIKSVAKILSQISFDSSNIQKLSAFKNEVLNTRVSNSDTITKV